MNVNADFFAGAAIGVVGYALYEWWEGAKLRAIEHEDLAPLQAQVAQLDPASDELRASLAAVLQDAIDTLERVDLAVKYPTLAVKEDVVRRIGELADVRGVLLPK